MRIQAIVKGHSRDTVTAVCKWVPEDTVVRIVKVGLSDTIVEVDSSAACLERQLAEWFTSDSPPFKPGSLLWYSSPLPEEVTT